MNQKVTTGVSSWRAEMEEYYLIDPAGRLLLPPFGSPTASARNRIHSQGGRFQKPHIASKLVVRPRASTPRFGGESQSRMLNLPRASTPRVNVSRESTPRAGAATPLWRKRTQIAETPPSVDGRVESTLPKEAPRSGRVLWKIARASFQRVSDGGTARSDSLAAAPLPQTK